VEGNKAMTLSDLQQKAMNEAQGKPFGSAKFHDLWIRFILTDSPAGLQQTYPRFTYYYGKNRVTKKGAVEILNNYAEAGEL
jgi:hypothetical protein